MQTLDALKQENQEISDLCEILSVLIEHKELRNNPFVCELVTKFQEKVWTHLVFEDNPIYLELVQQPDKEFTEAVTRFLKGSQAIKKRFADYVKCWCTPTDEEDHDKFVTESHDIMRLIMDRIHYENDKVFPLLAGRQPQ